MKKEKFKNGDVLYSEPYNVIAVYQYSIDTLGFDVLSIPRALHFPKECTHRFFIKIGEL